MNIYLYDKNTYEYIGCAPADADPEETKIQGHFIPLIPDSATIEPPPEYNENTIPVYFENSWKIENDYRKNFLKVNKLLEVFNITTIGEQEEGFIIVPKDLGLDIKNNPEKYKIISGTIVEKTEEEIQTENINSKIEQFETDFFETSLGWIRRSVTMKNGIKKDFLSDLLPAVIKGFELGNTVEVITYTRPDFTQELKHVEEYQQKKQVTQSFIQECLNQLVQDFGS